MGAVKFVLPHPPDAISEAEARVVHAQLLTPTTFSATGIQAALKIREAWEGGDRVDLTDDQKRATLNALDQLYLDARLTDGLRQVEQGLRQSLPRLTVDA